MPWDKGTEVSRIDTPELMARVSPDDLSKQGLKFSWTKSIDLGFARLRAARMAYVGGPGFELYVPVEMTRHVYLALLEAGADLGLRDAGYFALDALRIEMGRRAWGAELGPDETPFEAGLLGAIKLDKATPSSANRRCCNSWANRCARNLSHWCWTPQTPTSGAAKPSSWMARRWEKSLRPAGARKPARA